MSDFHFGPQYRAPQVRCCGKWTGVLASCNIPEPGCIYAKQKREQGLDVESSTQHHAWGIKDGAWRCGVCDATPETNSPCTREA